MIPILLRAGAKFDMSRFLPPTDISGESLTYLLGVDAAGGWKKYEQSHRTRLTTTFARVLFPHLPIGAISNIVCLWAHVGFY
jgi:hypothetical protein